MDLATRADDRDDREYFAIRNSISTLDWGATVRTVHPAATEFAPALANVLPQAVDTTAAGSFLHPATASFAPTPFMDVATAAGGRFAPPVRDWASAQSSAPFALGRPDGATAPVRTAPVAPSELIVQFNASVSSGDQAAVVAALGGDVGKTLRLAGPDEGDLLLIKFPTAQAAAAARSALTHNPHVTFAEANTSLGVQAVNDPYYASGSLWGMYGDKTSPPNIYGSQAGEAWSSGVTGSSSVVVGVIDTGIDYTHPDLYLNVWLNQGEIPVGLRSSLVDVDGDRLITFRDLNQVANASFVRDFNANGRIDAGDLLADASWENGLDEDGNGYRDDLIGWDFANNDNDPYDDNNHGTHVSGTIAGLGNNGTGVAGINWSTQVMALKFLGSTGSGSLSNAILATDYYTSAAKGAAGQFVATNNSWGGGGYSQALQDSITRAAKQDLLFVAAAGNGGSDGVGDNNDSVANYPSNYSTLVTAGFEAVVAVAALTSTGARASYSNYGPTTVDLGAPGSGIVSTVAGGGYASFSGTSMATPHVTGALALLASVAPQMTADQLRSVLLTSAAPTSSMASITVTGGRLDVSAMLRLAPSPDTTAPTATFSPAGGSANVALNSNLTLTFSEAVKLGAGTIVIRDSGGAVFESYDVGSASANIALAGNTLVINPTGEFVALGQYSVSFGPNVVLDVAGNGFLAPAYAFAVGTTANPLSLVGTSAAETLLGDSANDTLEGKGGIDVLDGRGGSDLYLIAAAADHSAAEIRDSGSSGIDEVRFTATNTATLQLYAGDTGIERVSLGLPSTTTALSVNAAAVLNGLEIIGNAGANTITGTVLADIIRGAGGNDVISAGPGNDLVYGGDGNDTLTGGAGLDQFVFDTAPNTKTSKDTITDFVSGIDLLVFDRAVFGGAGLAVGAITAAQFWASNAAISGHDADDRFIYNTKSGTLYYDPDGSGDIASVAVALLGTSTHPALLYSDIHVI